MTALKTLLQKLPTDPLIQPADGGNGLANAYDLLLARLSRAVVADGLRRETVMRLLMDHAFEVVNDSPGAAARARELVLQETLRLHSLFDGPVDT